MANPVAVIPSSLLTNVIDFSVNDGVSQPKAPQMITFVSGDDDWAGPGGGQSDGVTPACRT